VTEGVTADRVKTGDVFIYLLNSYVPVQTDKLEEGGNLYAKVVDLIDLMHMQSN
jgi:hypothetical protein